MPSDEPVLPPVNSTTRMPGRNAPRASAPSIMASAMRSLYEPVGLSDSSLTSTSAPPAGTTRRSRTTGVPPIARSTTSTTAVTSLVLLPRIVGKHGELRPERAAGHVERRQDGPGDVDRIEFVRVVAAGVAPET